MNRNWVCIDNKGYEEHLIVGKVYTEITDGFVDHQPFDYLLKPLSILIKDETGMLSEYHYPSRFITIDEWRDIQLKKIGI